MLNKTVMLCFEMTKLNQVTSVYEIEQRGESEKIGKKKKKKNSEGDFIDQ